MNTVKEVAGLLKETVAMLQTAYSVAEWQGYCRQEVNRLRQAAKEKYVSAKYLSWLTSLGEKESAF